MSSQEPAARRRGSPSRQSPLSNLATVGSTAPNDWLFLVEAARALRHGVPIRDRSHRFRIHACCFSGKEAVDWLKSSAFVATHRHEDAVWLAGRLLRAGFFHLVDAFDPSNGGRAAGAAKAVGGALSSNTAASASAGLAGHMRQGQPGRSQIQYRSTALYRFALDEDVSKRRFWFEPPAAAVVAGPGVMLHAAAGVPGTLLAASHGPNAAGTRSPVPMSGGRRGFSPTHQRMLSGFTSPHAGPAGVGASAGLLPASSAATDAAAAALRGASLPAAGPLAQVLQPRSPALGPGALISASSVRGYGSPLMMAAPALHKASIASGSGGGHGSAFSSPSLSGSSVSSSLLNSPTLLSLGSSAAAVVTGSSVGGDGVSPATSTAAPGRHSSRGAHTRLPQLSATIPFLDPASVRIQPQVACNSVLVTPRIADALHALLRAGAASSSLSLPAPANGAADATGASPSPDSALQIQRLASRALLRLLRHTRGRFHELASAPHWQRYTVSPGSSPGKPNSNAPLSRAAAQQAAQALPAGVQAVTYVCSHEWLPIATDRVGAGAGLISDRALGGAGISSIVPGPGGQLAASDSASETESRLAHDSYPMAGGVSTGMVVVTVHRLDNESVYPTFRTSCVLPVPPDTVLAALLDPARRAAWDALLCGGGIRQLGALDFGGDGPGAAPSLFARISAVLPPKLPAHSSRNATQPPEATDVRGRQAATPTPVPQQHQQPLAPLPQQQAGGAVSAVPPSVRVPPSAAAALSPPADPSMPRSCGAPGAAIIVSDYFSPRAHQQLLPLPSLSGGSGTGSSHLGGLAGASAAPSRAPSTLASPAAGATGAATPLSVSALLSPASTVSGAAARLPHTPAATSAAGSGSVLSLRSSAASPLGHGGSGSGLHTASGSITSISAQTAGLSFSAHPPTHPQMPPALASAPHGHTLPSSASASHPLRAGMLRVDTSLAFSDAGTADSRSSPHSDPSNVGAPLTPAGTGEADGAALRQPEPVHARQAAAPAASGTAHSHAPSSSPLDLLAHALLPPQARSVPPPRVLHCVGRALTPLVAPRDTVVLQDVGLWPDGSVVVYEVSVQSRDVPPSRACVRCDAFVDGYLLSPVDPPARGDLAGAGGKQSQQGPVSWTRVTRVSQLSHGRHLPLWLGNSLLGQQTYKAMQRLRLAVVGHGPSPMARAGVPRSIAAPARRRAAVAQPSISPLQLRLQLGALTEPTLQASARKAAAGVNLALIFNENSEGADSEPALASAAASAAVQRLPTARSRARPVSVGRPPVHSGSHARRRSGASAQWAPVAESSPDAAFPRPLAQQPLLRAISETPASSGEGGNDASAALTPAVVAAAVSAGVALHDAAKAALPQRSPTLQGSRGPILSTGGSGSPHRRSTRLSGRAGSDAANLRYSLPGRHLTHASILSEEFDYEAHGYIIGGPVGSSSASSGESGDRGDSGEGADESHIGEGSEFGAGGDDDCGVERGSYADIGPSVGQAHQPGSVDTQQRGLLPATAYQHGEEHFADDNDQDHDDYDDHDPEGDFADGILIDHGLAMELAHDDDADGSGKGLAARAGDTGDGADIPEDFQRLFAEVPADAASMPVSARAGVASPPPPVSAALAARTARACASPPPMPPAHGAQPYAVSALPQGTTSPSPHHASPATADSAAAAVAAAAAAGPGNGALSQQDAQLLLAATTVPPATAASAAQAMQDDGYAHVRSPVGVSDFELLTVLGRGGYGTVMQVRRVAPLIPPPGDYDSIPADPAPLAPPSDEGEVYAMKVLRKRDLVARGQVARTLNERRILTEMTGVGCPFIVGLKYAFQSRSRLVSA